MQCDVCQAKTAEVFLTHIDKGKVQKVNLCKDCSKERGVEDPTGFALTELLENLGTTVEIETPPQTPEPITSATKDNQLAVRTEPAVAAKCPTCGFTQTDFKKTGRLGCSECYDTFAESLGSLLKAMHKGTNHTGKKPERVARLLEMAERMKGLQDDLQRAVKAEDYENAASLRDQIRRLTSEIET